MDHHYVNDMYLMSVLANTRLFHMEGNQTEEMNDAD